jgi:hypothetical protein
LARIEALLQDAEASQRETRKEVRQAQADTESLRAQRRLSAPESVEGQDLTERFNAARNTEKEGMKQLRTIELSIEMLRSARERSTSECCGGRRGSGGIGYRSTVESIVIVGRHPRYSSINGRKA